MNKAVIRVSTPCTCGASKWWNCRCSSIIATYEGRGDYQIDGTGFPSRKMIDEVQNAHPGMELIYMDHPAQGDCP